MTAFFKGNFVGVVTYSGYEETSKKRETRSKEECLESLNNHLFGDLRYGDPYRNVVACILLNSMLEYMSNRTCTLDLCRGGDHCCSENARRFLLSDDARYWADLLDMNYEDMLEALDLEMDMAQYQTEARKTANPNLLWEEKITIAALGLAGESGEVANQVKKWAGQGARFSAAKIADELGDVLWYVSMMADVIGVTIEEIADRNVTKLQKRYPGKYVPDTEKVV